MRRPRRVLVVLDDCGPGDVMLVSFCPAALRGALPNARIDCLAGARALPAVRATAAFDRVIVSHLYDRGGGRGTLLPRKLAHLVALGLRLAGRYDLVLTLYWGTTALNVLGRLASRGVHAGYANAAPWLLSTRLGRYQPSGDAVGQAARLMAAAGFPAPPGPPIRVAPVAAVEDAPGGRYAVLHPGSDWACQQWVRGRWAELADHLVDGLGLEVVFTGLAREVDAIDAIRAAMRNPSRSLAGRTSVSQLAEVLGQAQLCVCVDSLAFELSQAAGTPTVVLTGQSRTRLTVAAPGPVAVVNRTSPRERADILSCKLSVLKASHGSCDDHGCPLAELRGIGVEDVYAAVLRVARHLSQKGLAPA